MWALGYFNAGTECSDAGLQMVGCWSLDGRMHVLGCGNFINENTVGKSRSTLLRGKLLLSAECVGNNLIKSFHF